MSYEKHLLRDRRFWPTFWTQFWGAFNDNVFKNAIVILITFKSFSLGSLAGEQMVALCGGIFILPFFLFSALAGQIADKYPKHKLMVAIKVWEIIVMLIGGAGFITENIYLLLASLFLMGLQSTFFGPVKYSVLPELINDDELVHGNALIEMGTFVSILLGTILGGLLIAVPESGSLYVASATVVLAIIGTLVSMKVTALKPANTKLKIEVGIIKPTWEIIKISKKIKGVWNSILGISWFWFLGAALLSLFPVYVKDVIHGNQEVVTLFLATFSIGVACGSIICEKLSKERLELGLVPFGAIGMTLFILDLYFNGSPHTVSEALVDIKGFLALNGSHRILIDLFLLSIFSGFFIVPLYTYIQQYSEDETRSRVIAGNNIINAAFMVASSLVLALLYQFGLSVQEIFLVFAILNIIVATYIFTIIPEFMIRFCIMILARFIYRLKVSNAQNIPQEGAAVLICNHVSFVDWMIISAGIKRPVRFVMHYSFMKIPILKYFLKAAKVIPIAGIKENQGILEEAMKQIAIELKAGELICIFPEGKITHDGELNPFKKGIERIITKTPAPVIPMALKGLWGSFFSRKHGPAASRPSVIRKTIWSQVELEITAQKMPESVNAELLEAEVRKMLKPREEELCPS